MGRAQFLDSLELYDHTAVYQEVCFECANHPTPETSLKAKLLLYSEATGFEGNRHRFSVDRLQEPVAELIINIEEHSDDPLSDVLMLESALICVHLRPRFFEPRNGRFLGR